MRSKTSQFWLGVLLATAALVCALPYGTPTRSPKAGPATVQAESSQPVRSPNVPANTYEGIVTDTRCGARHSAKVDLSAADCTRFCVHNGERFALVDGDKTYILNGERARLKRMAGERVRIAGTLSGNTIEVISVAEPNPRAE